MIELRTALRMLSWTLVSIGTVGALGEICHLSSEAFSLLTIRLAAMIGFSIALLVLRGLR